VADQPGRPDRLSGWGRTAPTTATVVPVGSYDDAVAAVTGAGPRGVLARGLGRSYGDAAQNAGGVVLDLTRLARVHSVDADARLVRCDAGVSLDTLMRTLLPFGLWLPVVPGTRQVTVGGAIAADVHGKNHHVEGSFGNHVVSLDLLTADGFVWTLGPDGPDPELFWATIGGMGLTGVILGATIRLARVETAYFLVDTERTEDLAGLMRRLSEDDDKYTYSVAWFDSVATGKHLGRAVLTRGRQASSGDLPGRLRRDPLRFDAPRLATVPDVFPSGLLNRWTARAFNEFWYRKAPVRRIGEVQNITTFFHPLDVLAEWNRLYGRRGLCQYQFVVPFGAEAAFTRAVELIAESGQVSCLNVLKRFGPANRSPLSFPAPGWTLAVDLPVTAGLGGLLRDLDDLVLAAGGRVYLAKDSRLDPDTFAKMYPRLPEFEAVRRRADPGGVFRSDLSRRLNLGDQR
jgi:decaprenylphospho-beta-D-ribofuranose 2-oxidase